MNICCNKQMKEVKRDGYKIYSCVKCSNIHTVGDISKYQEDKNSNNT